VTDRFFDIALHAFGDVDAAGLHADDREARQIVVRLDELVGEPPERTVEIGSGEEELPGHER